MRFVQIDMLPSGKALVEIDELAHAVPEGDGSRLFLGARHLNVPYTLGELENVQRFSRLQARHCRVTSA